MFFNLQVHIIIPTNRAITIKAKTYKQKLYTHIKHKREAFCTGTQNEHLPNLL